MVLRGGGPAIVQGVVAVLMATTIFYTVTGFLVWLLANVLAGVAGLIAAASWRRPGVTRGASLAATVLFVPLNLAFGLGSLDGGDPVPVALVIIALAQVAAFVWSWRAASQA